MERKTTLTKKQAFLAAVAVNGTVTKAAELVEMERSSHYRWLDEDPEYAEAFSAAKEQFVERLESEAVRRATEGVREPILYEGKLCGTKLRYSDTLLIFLLKGHAPEKYRERWELTGNVNLTTIPAALIDAVMARAQELKQPRALPPVTESGSNSLGSQPEGSK